jgi:hypothetical protein
MLLRSGHRVWAGVISTVLLSALAVIGLLMVHKPIALLHIGALTAQMQVSRHDKLFSLNNDKIVDPRKLLSFFE